MKIMVAIDLSRYSEKIVEQAKILAQALSARIWILHVADKYHKEHKQLQSISQGLRSVDVDCSALLVQGTVADTILNEAGKLSVDIIVLGSHGKGLVKQLFIGSTSEEVLKKSIVPVYIVPTRPYV